MENLKDKILKESIWGIATKGTTFVLFFLINIYLARRLGVNLYGRWSYFFSILSIIFLLSYFGINASSKKYIAEHNYTNNLRSVLKSSLKLRTIFSLIISILLAILYYPLSILLNIPDLAYLFLLASPLIFLSGFVEFLKEIFMGLHKLKYNFITNCLEYGLKLILIIIFLNFSLELESVINSYIIASLITVVIGMYLLYVNFYNSYQKSNNEYTKGILEYSLPLFFISIGFAIATEIDTIMIGLLVGQKEVAIYSIAKQIVIKLPQITMAFAMGTLPLFAQINNENKSKIKKLFYKLLKINSILFGIIVLGILFLSDYFIPLIYGPEYINSALSLKILSIYLFCFSTSIIFNGFLDYQGFANKRAINIIVMITLNILLNLFLIPKYGAVGASIATSISYLPYILLNWIEINKILNNKTKRLFFTKKVDF